ncbi:hypothetical protein Tco_0937478 [Tanacetum coccineum]|uniref:Uncharacterized protein n=1 Tax=Tanacetum coccineum TaxID=301880 RepID=A0ABQ5DFB1_9ASTR
MLAPKCSTFNGRPTFANPMYHKKAQYEHPGLYAITQDQSDPATRLIPDSEEILTLADKSRSKLDKDLVITFDLLEMELDELESENKAEFSNMYDYVFAGCCLKDSGNVDCLAQKLLTTEFLLKLRTIDKMYTVCKEKAVKCISKGQVGSIGKLLTLARARLENEPTHGSNVDITLLMLQTKSGLSACARYGFTKVNILHNDVLINKAVRSLGQSMFQMTLVAVLFSQAVNKSPTHYPCDSARTFRVILFSIHNDEWKSFQCHHQTALRSYALSWKPCQGDSLNLPDHRIHKDGDGDASFQLKSDSLPHAHAQTTKTYYKHRDSRIMKAQELKTKTSAQTLIYKIFLQRYQVYQGRLLASFQDDAKYEHVGQDTRSQGSDEYAYSMLVMVPWDRMGTPTQYVNFSLLLTPLCCDDTHDVTPRVSALAGCDRLGIVVPTGLKRYKDPETGLRIKRTNRKCRIPIDLYPCRVEEKLIMRKLEGKWIMKKEMRMISKDGTISEFPGYTSSKEEKEEEEEEEEEKEESE